MSVRREETTKEVAAFTLALPTEFDLKPAFEIALPAGRVALVYNTLTKMDDYDGNGKNIPKDKPAWRLVLKTKRGTFLHDNGFRIDYAGHVFTDPLLLSLFVQKLVVEYSKKRKITVEETDQED